jgi:SAM-dependent methyltransferase
MEVDAAAALIAPGVGPPTPTPWADLGAGRGTFTRALAGLLGPGGRVAAVDRDPAAVAALAALAARADGPPPNKGGAGRPAAARVTAHRADFADPAALDALFAALGWPALGGALLANALHFVAAGAQAAVLGDVAARLAPPGPGPGGRLVVVEYEGRRPGPWVPAPVSFARLAELAEALGGRVAAPVRVGERPSAFGGAMYAAYLERRA